MRIIAGRLGGRMFDSPHSAKTHPMSDKMRGALFNILGDNTDLRVLDAFAGSGALSLEALSRGARAVVAVDSDRVAQKTIAGNIRMLGLEGRIKLIRSSANAWLTTSAAEDKYDIVLCDPPYNDLQPALLQRLTARVAPGGIFALSWPQATSLPEFTHISLLLQRNYGDAQLAIYRRPSTPE